MNQANKKKSGCTMLCGIMLLSLFGCSQPKPVQPQTEKTGSIVVSEVSSDNTASVPSESKADISSGTDSIQAEEKGSAVSSRKPVAQAEKPASSAASRPAQASQSSRTQTPVKPPVTSASVSSAGQISSAQEPDKQETPAKKDPYAYPFDIEAIKKDLIEYGKKLGMKHRTHYSDGSEVTPENGSYELPTYLSKDSTTWIIKKALYEQLDYHYNVYKAEVFTIYIKSYGNSEYQIYSIYA